MSTVAVLGGGISGLSAAYYLARLASPKTRIVLIEGTDRVGGWIRSQRTPEHNILFEAGPRSLRPVSTSGVVTLEMIKHLELEKDIIAVPKTDPSARNRYIYYNDHINVLPNSLRSFLFQKPDVMNSVLTSILFEPFKPVGKLDEDESIYSLVSRRFNEHIALNLVGAIVHGIYAGDVKQLSVKSTLRLLYDNERVYGSIVKGMVKGGAKSERFRERGMAARARKDDPDWFADMEQQSVIGFRNGTETLTHQLRRWLEAQENVQVVLDEPVRQLTFKENNNECKIATDKRTWHAEHVISALPSRILDGLISSKLPHLSTNPSVDVAVVNLAYAPDTTKLDLDGFGFLTPYPDSKYKVPVPGTLGVVFDSNAIKGQDTKPFLKTTVMMGGHQWSQAFKAPIEQLDPQDAYDMAIRSMKSYLSIDARPEQSMVHLQAKCIPQYLVGHQERLEELHQAMRSKFGHSLSVTGASYWGVSVPDCIKNSRELVEELVVSGALGSRSKVVTGLGRVEEVHDSDRIRDSARISKGHVNVLMRS